ncbi:ATP-grasp domain-containing protein [Sphingomonas sp. M1-B02]|uniref:ATP-grasp domain-containing protein n=1 Tax=Sphingomonas sp. M1-B02 TaxID=3114300 RepID=UPI00223FDA7C|nr:ATP-grasp domain-containing protein [Sphingomonas sp. S6-11]UZK66670.1 ATP-grasp domain-containing protein [Sphingomonas sp. S6-11]
MKIFVSGLYAGGNPQPGVGIVRSLRQGYPDATIVGVEYSNGVSGIHFDELDDLWIQRPWGELDLESYGQRVREVLDAGGLWISGSDLEAMWLASVFPDGHANLLAPPMAGIKRITKPVVEAASGLPVRIPTYLSTEHSDWDLHAFCRAQDWRVWLKGPYYDASRTPTWDAFTAVRNALSKVWSTEKLFLQAHVSGYEESVMLSAYQGELLGAVSMRKRDVTAEGKTWAGDVSDVPPEFLEPLRRMVRDTNWTGGGELEMVRDASDQLWLIEMNPRFPAWVHGATIAGHNLPALLVQAATGVRAQPVPAQSAEFTRVVLEVPVRADYPLPPLPEPFAGAVGHSMKHPSGLTALAARLHKIDPDMLDVALAPEGSPAPNAVSALPETYVADIGAQDFGAMQTPQYIYMESTAEALFASAAERARRLSTDDVEVISGYSIKTNPDKRLIKLALDNGFYAEAISLGEVQTALEVGFRPDQVILNGPGKWWPEGLMPRETMHAVFCDSVADLDRVVAAVEAGEMSARHIGIRIRTPNITSRFGIPLDSPTTFAKLIEAVKRLPTDSKFGVHFHMASSHVGVAQWWHLFESMLRWCRSIERLSGRTIEMLDMGGGWYPDDWHADETSKIAHAAELVRAMLPAVRQIASEPGKAMAQPSMALAMRVLEIQEHEDDMIEAVVDASIAEIPMHFWQPHRMVRQCGETGALQPIGRGKTYLMGRLCMEHDIIASNVQLPEGTRAGDLLIFCDAGGYDRSMSYVFGRG